MHKSPLFDYLQQRSIDLINASEQGDETESKTLHKALYKLCHENHEHVNDHPLQWEALGDFATDYDMASRPTKPV